MVSAVNRKIEALIQVEGGWLRCSEPVRVVQARSPDAVVGALAEVDRLTRQGAHYAVGFVTYEAAAAFGLTVHASRNGEELPLVWFGLFDIGHVDRLVCLPAETEPYELGTLTASVDRSAFEGAFGRIKQHLADGDTYQANYTFRIEGSFRGHARSLFADLTTAQRGQHSAFIELGSHAICSASPELFFERTGLALSARPMKGTAARGRTLTEDRAEREQLHASAKQRAENVMIVDMVRNDLGRIATIGSVRVPELFAVERYPSVWQMTSLVTARSSAPLPDLFAALHPSASVTGAPKVRTMAILDDLEGRPRGVYTGAIGLVEPGGTCHFNVAIRTAVINHRSQTVEFGVGSGIVWDSDAEDEYRECLLKGSVLGRRPIDFDLLETLRWSAGEGFLLLDRHLQRMRESAEYFDFPYDAAAVQTVLRSLAASLMAPLGSKASYGDVRVRLLLSRQGDVRVEHRPLEVSTAPMHVRIARDPVDNDDPFLFHKTTNRAVYDRARSSGSLAPANPVNPANLVNPVNPVNLVNLVIPDEVILWNASREVTEATTANVVLEVDGVLVTPPIECGLLGGTFRAEMLARGKVREAVVTLDQLRRAKRVWLINSVHQWREAVVGDGQGQAGQATATGQARQVGQVGQATGQEGLAGQVTGQARREE